MSKHRKKPTAPKAAPVVDVDSAGLRRGPKPDHQLTETERRVRRGNPWERNRDTIHDLTAAVDAIVATLADLRTAIPDLLRIQEHDATDSYPASTRAAETPSGKSSYTPVERATLAGWPGDREDDERPDSARRGPPADPARRTIEAIWTALHRVDSEAAGIAVRQSGVYLTATKHVGRQDTTSTCEACLRDVSGAEHDRLRSGYCEACYRQWLREERPDRVAFQQRRQHTPRREAS